MITFLLTLGARLVPGVSDLHPTRRAEVASIIRDAIDARPSRLQRQLALFLFLVRWLPVVRYGRRFDRLDGRTQDAVLDWLMTTSLAPLRHGFWGVKTLVYMGYYGHLEVARGLGYRPLRDGNTRLRAR